MSETPHRKLVYFFGEGASEGDPDRKDILGGKGASLASMSRAGLPVPPGFTLSAECCGQGAGWPLGLEGQVREAMARLERLMGRPFGRGPRPLLVAVRSGAAASMPGMMDTILNCGLNPSLADCLPGFWADYADHIRMFARSVAGISLSGGAPAEASAKARDDGPEAEARELLALYEKWVGRPFPLEPWDVLAQATDAVFASWFSERAVAYRTHHDIRGIVGTAVNVQAMFPSERAGVLFTANPNDIRANEMVLEASWGLGEAVVSGAVTPDIYILDADTLAIERATPGDRPEGSDEPALTPDQIRELGEMGRKVQGYFGVPCDIEWGLADGRLSLLQSRPIRGLDVLEDVEIGREAEIARLLEQAGGQRVVWVLHNLAETLAAPTPLTWDIVRCFMSGSGGYGRMYRDFGYRPTAQVCREGFLDLICGRIYVDPRRAAGMYWDGMPLEYDIEQVLGDPTTLETVPKKLNIEKADPAFFLRLPRLVWAMLRSSRAMRRARAEAAAAFQQRALPAFLAFLAEARAMDLASLPTGDLIAELHRRRAAVLGDFGKESLKPGFFGGMAQQALLGLLTQLMGPEQGADLMRLLTTGLEHDTTVEQNVALYRVARGEASLEDFLADYGHRAVNEMELSQPRWREDPSYLKRMVESFRGPDVVPPDERHARQVEARRRTEAALPARLAEWGGACLLERIRAELDDAQQLLSYRETGKHYLMMGYETIRAVLVELARRWDLGRDVFFLRLDELDRFEGERAAFEKEIASRKLRWRSAQRLSPSFVVDSENLAELGKPRPRVGGAALTGCSLASGAATGVARIVFDPQETGDLGTGYILVCPSTDPGWTPLFVHARGLIVERGGVLSHGAIVARDFGIPAVVCENATDLIPNGATVHIDGTNGTIVIERDT